MAKAGSGGCNPAMIRPHGRALADRVVQADRDEDIRRDGTHPPRGRPLYHDPTEKWPALVAYRWAATQAKSIQPSAAVIFDGLVPVRL